MKPVLVLIDLQRDFLAEPGLEPAAGEVVRGARRLLEECRARGIPVLHVRTTVGTEPDGRMPHWRRAGLEMCVAGTPGHEPPPELRERGEEVVDKRWFSAFSALDMEPALERAGADTLILAGVHLHGCVRSTALDAYERGLGVLIAREAVGGYDGLHGAVSAAYLDGRAGRVLGTDEILELAERDEHAGAPAERRDPRMAAAAQAVADWAAEAADERARRLARAAGLVEDGGARLVELMIAEIGKPRRHAEAEVARAAALLRAASALPEPQPRRGPEATARRVPLGLVAVITPFNNPVAVPIGKLGPALRLGNAVAWKPSPLASDVSAEVASILAEAGLGEPLVTLVAGGADTALSLMRDPLIDGVSLTGSSAAGHAAQAAAAARRVPLQAELGGNNAAIVWSDAAVDLAAAEIAEAGLGFAGQRCTANRRVVADRAIVGPLVEALERAAADLPAGDPSDPGVSLGPLVNQAAHDRVSALLERAGADADVHRIEPRSWSDPGRPLSFLPAAIVVCEDPDAEIVQEETFGPVIVVQPADGFEAALELADGVRQGLVMSLFSADPGRRDRFLRTARAGVLKLDQATADAGVDAPFGGWKASGIGPAEHGEGDVEFYTRLQAVYGA